MAFRTHTHDREVRDVRDVDTPVVTDERSAVVEERAHEMPPWSPAQIIGLIIGIGMTVLGIAAIAQVGFDTADIYQPQELVWGLPHSPLLAVCEIGFGLVIFVDSARDDLTRWFGVSEDRSAWFFVIVGGVTLLAAMLSPVFYPRSHRRMVDVRDTRAAGRAY